MAKSQLQLINLYQEALNSVIASPESWLAFLESTGRNYGYPFQDQLLIHHQRPNALAVLTYDQWNNQFRRRIRRGATGIATFGRSNGRTTIQYYFDVRDTYATRDSRPVPLWTVDGQDIPAIMDTLQKKFEVDAPVLPQAITQVSHLFSPAVVESSWHRISDVSPVEQPVFAQLLENSLSYMLLYRMGYGDYATFEPADFDALAAFQNPEVLHLLGESLNTLGKIILTEIAATVRNSHILGQQFFAKSQAVSYDEARTEETYTAQGGQEHGNELQDGERTPAPGGNTAGRDPGDGEVRPASGTVPDGTPAEPVHDTADQRDSEPAPDGDPENRRDDAGEPDGEAAGIGGTDGGSESPESPPVGRDDEQPPAQRRGDDSAGPDLHLTAPDKFIDSVISENAGSNSLPAFSNRVQNRGDSQLSMFDATMFIEAETVVVDEAEPEGSAAESIPTANFRITDENLGCGSTRQKFVSNIAAIKLLKELEQDNRNATSEEQETLSRYVGWGGMPQAFEPDNPAWSSEYQELKDLLTEPEYSAARESTLNAHYTSPTVIKAIYEAVGNMGFTTGNILEPSCGVGNFFGLLPEEMFASQLYGVELDSVSGRIAKKLYPNADITVAGFETTDRRNFYDLAIGNVPFGRYRVNDKAYNALGFNIHNYFFAKAIDQVRPGGVIAFVTSRYTMDSKTPTARKYIAERAELLGAIRLPNNAFLANAGAQVVSDILFLQKRESPVVTEPDWIHLGQTSDGVVLNQYFIDHPEMVLGTLKNRSTQYGREECTVEPIPGADLSQQLHEAVQHIRGHYTIALESDVRTDDSIPADPDVKNFSFSLVGDKVYYRENSRMKLANLSATAEPRVRGLMELRDTLRTLITYETEDYPEGEIQAQQQRLNLLYDAFQKQFGLINSRQNKQAFSVDDSYYLLCSLEILNDEGGLKQKADIFTKRTIRPAVAVTHVDTAQEALMVCMDDRAVVDLPFMAALVQKTPEEVIAELQGQIFKNPAKGDAPLSGWEIGEEYLSGNVRNKLREARAAAERDPVYAPNVTALSRVQPKDLSPGEISVRLGSTWVPEEDVRQFVMETLNPPWYLREKIHVYYSPYTGSWQVTGKSVDGDSILASSTYGTKRINAYHIIEQSLNLRDVKVYDYKEVNGKRVPSLNKTETTIARSKQTELRQAFQDWVWKDPDRRQRLTTLYNEKFNNLRPREYDGSHLTFPGMNPEISLRTHQRNAIAHALYGGNTLLAHCVGAGKTFEMVAIAQKSKQLGLCHKSMIVVPNHLIGQWASEYLQLYPAANILVATEKDFTPGNRKTFCSRIATGDYDAVIIGHSQFEKIPLSKERQVQMLEQQIDDIVEGIAEISRNGGNNFTIKQLERSRKSVQSKLQKLNDQSRKDDVVTFEELGIDRLFMDEAHEFKNLAAITKMQNVAGISQTESQKASDLFLKCRYLDELTDSRGIIFGTGTPISNTMVEMYTMQRYLQYKTLSYYGLSHFDAWAANFGETVTAIELAPEGNGYRTKTRFARFYNLPELIYMFRMVADIQTADMLKLPVPKANYHVDQLEPSDLQVEMVSNLSTRADRVRNKMVNPQEDNMLKITSDGRKLALDQRLMNPMLSDSETSKASACAKNVFSVWEATTENKGAQIIFCDLSTPHFDDNFNVYDDLRNKLMEMGIPKTEIAYIHEAPTEAKKKLLFQKVRSGQVRVLIGSTAKMGTGTNVQTRLAALHDIDCPWRPSDLEQRSGRIIRQGNTYPEVDIFRYVTKGTFDGYSWQIIENKQRFISQIMTSKSPARTMEETDEFALSYAEIKALTTSNPLIKEKMDLDVEVSRLTLLKSSFLSQKYALEDKALRHIPNQIREINTLVKRYAADAEHAANRPATEPGTISPMTIQGRTFTEKKGAGAAILESFRTKRTPEDEPLGEYCGFQMYLRFEPFTKEFQVILRREASYTVSLGPDLLGNIQRIDNAISGIAAKAATATTKLETLQQELATAKAESQKQFPHEQELQEKTLRLQELNSLLNMDGKDDTILDETEEVETDITDPNRQSCR